MEIIGLIINLGLLALCIYGIYYHFAGPAKEQQKFDKQQAESAMQFADEYSEQIKQAERNYREAIGNIIIPSNADTIDVETTVFGGTCDISGIYTGIGIGKEAKECFYIWHDESVLYVYPTKIHLEINRLHFIGKKSFNPSDIQLYRIPDDNIIYYANGGKNDIHVVDKSANKPNIRGAIVGGIVGGEAGAVIGAMTPKRVPDLAVWNIDSRHVIIAYEEKGLLKGIKVSTKAFPLLEKWFPEKEYSQVQYQRTKMEQSDSITEIVKYKELLDMGIISQEEFDAKKKQLLGL